MSALTIVMRCSPNSRPVTSDTGSNRILDPMTDADHFARLIERSARERREEA
jgi:hypothetical protein